MSEIKDTRFIKDNAVKDEDILLDNNDWLRGRNQANTGNVNMVKLDASDRLHLGDAATGKPVVMGAQLSADPTGVLAGFYYNTTDNSFKFYNGTSWGEMGGANKFLSNLTSPTAVNQSLLSSASNTLDLGSFSNVWANIFQDTAQFRNNSSSSITGKIRGANYSTPAGYSTSFYVVGFGGGGMSVSTDNNSTADANPTGAVYVESGNKTAGTGDSGPLILRSGTSAGGSRGKIILSGHAANLPNQASDPSSPAAGDVYYNTTSNKYRFYDGTVWADISSGGGATSILNTVLYFEDSSNINISAPGDAFDNVGFVVTAGDRIWLNFQTTPTENGMWVWNGNAVPLTRPTGWTNGSTIPAGTLISVTGNVSTQHNRFTTWLTGYADKVVGTDDLISTLHGFGSVVGYNLIPWIDGALTLGEPGKLFSAVYTNNVITGNDLTLQGTRAFLYGAGASAGISVEIHNSDNTDSTGGVILIHTGNEQDAADVASGAIQINTGNTDSGNSGDFVLFTGDADDVNGAGLNAINSGNITMSTGQGLTDSKSGYVHISSGVTTSGDGDSGEVQIYSGDTLNGISGTVGFKTGDSDSNATGDLNFYTGTSNSSNSGNLFFQSGGAGATRGYASFDIFKLNVNAQDGGLVLTNAASDLPSPDSGSIYFNTTLNKLKFYNGTTWETVTSV